LDWGLSGVHAHQPNTNKLPIKDQSFINIRWSFSSVFDYCRFFIKVLSKLVVKMAKKVLKKI